MNPLSPVLAFRGPLEIIALIAGLLPFLIILRAWETLPEEVPTHFGITGRPDRWGGRWQAWILPVVSIGLYVVFSIVTGTWSWVLGRQAELPRGMELMVLMKPMACILMAYISRVTVRVARKETERLNPWIMFGLVAIMVVPAIALGIFAKR